MKKLNAHQKRYFYLGVTLFISLTLVMIVSNFFTKANIILTILGSAISALTPLWIGLIIAYLINPIVMFFEKKIFLKLFKEKQGLARAISVVVSILLLLAFLIILILLVIPQLVTTISMLVKNFPGYWKGIQNWATDFAKENTVFGPKLLDILTGAYDKLMNWLQNDLLPNANLLGTVAGGIFSAVGLLVNFFIGLIISIYLMCDKENFLMRTKKVMASVFSKKMYKRTLSVLSETHEVFGGFITGKILDSILIGFVVFVFMEITRMPYAPLISVLLAVCNLIPIFGVFIGMVPSFLLILVVDPVKAVIWLVVVIVYMQIDGNVISPKILGNSIGLGSFWILFSITLFGGMFGVVGMLIGVPVFAMIYRYAVFFINKHLKKKGMPTESVAYAGPELPEKLPEKEE